MLNQFELIKIFTVAAETRSFKEAATQLGKSPQSVTRAIKELERLRGEILFYRSTRNIQITREGEALALEACLLLKSINSLVSPSTMTHDTQPAGHVSLTAPASLGRRFVIPLLNTFRKQHPEITLSCTLTDSHSDVIDEKIDIGLRTGFLRDNRFVARKIRDVKFYVVGTPELLQRTGIPDEVEHLSHMPVVALFDHRTGRYWPWGFDNDKPFTPCRPVLTTDDLEAYCDSVLAGTGYGQLADYLALPLIEKGMLVPVMTDKKPSTWGLYIYRTQNGPVPARVRLLFDYLFHHLKLSS